MAARGAALLRLDPLDVILSVIAEAIQYAHQRGILHRDLKPSNILLDQEDRPRVTDFGLAKQLAGESDLTMTGQVLGSPSYLSPVQAGARPEANSPRSDVYSLGPVLYQLLTGRPPFVAETVSETLQQVVSWDTRSGKALTEPLRHRSKVWSAQFSPDGLRVITACEDKTARLWEMTFGPAPVPPCCLSWPRP